jgi:ABC-type transporter Mla maintaining outer membrane lipid asymmetry permease subunit MlaE
MAVSQLALATYFSTLAIVSGIIFAAFLESPANFRYLFGVVTAFHPTDLLAFVFKNLLFGIIISATACFHGLRVGISVTEIPRATQQAIVHALVIVFLLDGFVVLVLG